MLGRSKARAPRRSLRDHKTLESPLDLKVTARRPFRQHQPRGASAASSPLTTQLTWKPYSWRRSPFSSTSNKEKPLHGERNVLQTRVLRKGPPWLKQVVLPRSLEYALLVWGCQCSVEAAGDMNCLLSNWKAPTEFRSAHLDRQINKRNGEQMTVEMSGNEPGLYTPA